MMDKFDQYLLLKKIGTGGMAELFKAKKVGIEGFERVLAIKRILPHLSSDEEFVDMFIAEGKLAALLNHKNIVQIYDFGKVDESYYIAMEYVAGKDLRTIFNKCRSDNIPVPLPVALYVCREVASGLDSAHNQKDPNGRSLNLIHRDISPQNILISYDGEVKVVDFGIAKAGTSSKTTTGVLKGKLSYMSPEQAWGKALDHRSDLFSLGVCLYEMLSGERLFKGETEIGTLEKVREARIETLPSALNAEVTPSIESKILKSLAKDASQRYQKASDMEQDFSAALFEISETDPAAQLRQFMHDLFIKEIEEEQYVDSDQTVYLGDSKSASSKKSGASRSTGKKGKSSAAKKFGIWSHKTYIYAISALVLLVAVVGVYFATRGSFQRSDISAAVPSGQIQPHKNSVNQPLSKDQPAAQASQSTKPNEVIKKEKGTLRVITEPWADVFVGNKKIGRAEPQLEKDIDVGTYTVTLKNPDFKPWTGKVMISENKVREVSHKLEKSEPAVAKGFGTLMIQTKPWANVFLDGVPKGVTPTTIPEVPEGKHNLKFTKKGYVDATQTVDVKPSAETVVHVDLKKEN